MPTPRLNPYPSILDLISIRTRIGKSSKSLGNPLVSSSSDSIPPRRGSDANLASRFSEDSSDSDDVDVPPQPLMPSTTSRSVRRFTSYFDLMSKTEQPLSSTTVRRVSSTSGLRDEARLKEKRQTVSRLASALKGGGRSLDSPDLAKSIFPSLSLAEKLGLVVVGRSESSVSNLDLQLRRIRPDRDDLDLDPTSSSPNRSPDSSSTSHLVPSTPPPIKQSWSDSEQLGRRPSKPGPSSSVVTDEGWTRTQSSPGSPSERYSFLDLSISLEGSFWYGSERELGSPPRRCEQAKGVVKPRFYHARVDPRQDGKAPTTMTMMMDEEVHRDPTPWSDDEDASFDSSKGWGGLMTPFPSGPARSRRSPSDRKGNFPPNARRNCSTPLGSTVSSDEDSFDLHPRRIFETIQAETSSSPPYSSPNFDQTSISPLFPLESFGLPHHPSPHPNFEERLEFGSWEKKNPSKGPRSPLLGGTIKSEGKE
ncbi:hypothetical protein IE53DRAFT_390416 [Violaceomyces palustris]|uniref:Uncharacterized protein n=1 Tax=Violaceomyces palustris TaxID=1673888 RepID=A0ACD0NNQ7_9BASI|nr:hypothetical protein IE53DRAFT_390416 [Violaceomyces palustris]